MRLRELVFYAKQLGCRVAVSTFDSGQTLAITREDGVLFRATYYWGEETRFAARLQAFLHQLSWPTEDDPRTTHEGVYA